MLNKYVLIIFTGQQLGKKSKGDRASKESAKCVVDRHDDAMCAVLYST